MSYIFQLEETPYNEYCIPYKQSLHPRACSFPDRGWSAHATSMEDYKVSGKLRTNWSRVFLQSRQTGPAIAGCLVCCVVLCAGIGVPWEGATWLCVLGGAQGGTGEACTQTGEAGRRASNTCHRWRKEVEEAYKLCVCLCGRDGGGGGAGLNPNVDHHSSKLRTLSQALKHLGGHNPSAV